MRVCPQISQMMLNDSASPFQTIDSPLGVSDGSGLLLELYSV
jgi:hypothetical protein